MSLDARSCPPCSLVSPKRMVGCRGGSRYVEGVLGFLVSWFLAFLVSKLLGFLVVWFLFFAFLVSSKFLGFKVSKSQSLKDLPKLPFPFHVSNNSNFPGWCRGGSRYWGGPMCLSETRRGPYVL